MMLNRLCFLGFCLSIAGICGNSAQAAADGFDEGAQNPGVAASLLFDDPDISYTPPFASLQSVSVEPAEPSPESALPVAIVSQAAAPERHLPPTPSRFLREILAAARETNVEPALIHAVISVESGYNPAARSPGGAIGLMQLMPGTAKRYGVRNSLDPAQNIHGGARYLRDLLVMFDNDLQLVLAAYNAGEVAVIRYGRRIPPFRATLAFVPKVMGHYKSFRGPRSGAPGD